MPTVQERLRNDLDTDQFAAVQAFGPQTLVVAGAGSGKTRVLVYGLAYLLETQHFSAEEVVLLTFTRKAAETMRVRAADVVGEDLSKLRCGTFHAVGALLLRETGRDFTILDEVGAQALIAEVYEEMV